MSQPVVITPTRQATRVIPDGTRPGADGWSAYQVAVANGFTGSVSQWLASLIGPAGHDGRNAIPMGEIASASALPADLKPGDSGKFWVAADTGNSHSWDGSRFIVARYRGLDGDLTEALGDARYAKLSHGHRIEEVDGLRGAIDVKLDASAAQTAQAAIDERLAGVDGRLKAVESGKAPAAHEHQMWNIRGLLVALDGKAALKHSHDIPAVQGLQAELDKKLNTADYSSTDISAADLLAKLLDVDGVGSGLNADLLDGKHGYDFAVRDHSHGIGDTHNLYETLNLKVDESTLNTRLSSKVDTSAFDIAIAGRVPSARLLNTGVGIQGGGALSSDLTISVESGAIPATAPVLTSGSLDDLGIGFWTIKHTNSPTNSWGRVECFTTGEMIVQRFQGDNENRTIYERRKAWNGWTSWDEFGPITTKPLEGGLLTQPGWSLSEISLTRSGNVGMVSFVTKPGSQRNAGEHRVAAANGALNAHVRSGMNRITGTWQSVFGDGQGGSIVWDRPSAVFFLHNSDGTAAGIGHACQFTFVIG